MAEISFDGERLSRYFKGEGIDKDASYINEVFCDKKNERELEHFLRRQFWELLKKDEGQEKNLDEILYRIHYEINNKNPKFGRNRLLSNIIKWTGRIAAILILPMAIYSVIHLLNISKNEHLNWVEIKAPAWTRAQFSLPDGTTGWLNSNSSIKYDVRFNNNRQVTLDGEAFFDVYKDSKKPFEVSTDGILVTVSGTKFNIASYDNENIIDVVLEEGEVVCYNEELNYSFTLKPNDYLSFDKTLNEYKVEVVQPEKYSSWKEGKLEFRNDPLNVIASRLERWYNIEVEIKGNISNQFRLRATFIDESLDEVLRLLELSLPIYCDLERPYLPTDGIYSKTKVIITSKD